MKTFLNYILAACALFSAITIALILGGVIRLPQGVIPPAVAAETTAATKAVPVAEAPSLLENVRTNSLKGNLKLSDTVQQWTVQGQKVQVKVVITKDTGGAVLVANNVDDPATLLPQGVKYVLAPHPRLEGKQLIGVPESEAAKFQ